MIFERGGNGQMTELTRIAELYAAAVREHRLGKIAAAETVYREIISDFPDHADALHMLGVIAQQSGRSDEARDLFAQAVSISPANAQFQNNYGVALRASGHAGEAAAHFRRAISLNSNSADAHYNLGNALLDQGDAAAAISAFSNALAIAPDSVTTRNGLASAYRYSGDLSQSIALYEDLVSEAPNNIAAHNNLGVVKMESGDMNGAVDCYRKALEIENSNLETLNNISVAFLLKGDAVSAERMLWKALGIAPKSATALANLGNALRRQGRSDEAAAQYRKALAIEPNDGLRVRLATVLPIIAHSSEAMASARQEMENSIDALLDVELSIDDPISQIGATNFHLSYHDENNRRLNSKIAQLYHQACPALRFVAPHCRRHPPTGASKLKVGFISQNLRNHAVGWCYHRLIRNLPREMFHVVAFSFDGSDDAVWRAISESVAKAVVVPPNLRAAQEIVAREELDILVYTDIGLDPITYFLAFARLAPIQCVTNGHPDTTGITAIDYFLSSEPLEDEGSSAHYSETLAALQNVLVDYERPERPEPVRPRSDFGLPDDVTLYVCPQSLFKIHPDMDMAFASILEQDLKAHLVIFSGPEPRWGEMLHQRWQNRFGENIKRIQILKRQTFTNFLIILRHADVVLDTWPFCGGNTTYQAFAMGRPVVTLPGQFARGRSTLALYRKMGITDLIANSPESYAELAVRLGNERAWREELVARIDARSDRLFGDGGAVDAFANFFLEVSGRSTSDGGRRMQ